MINDKDYYFKVYLQKNGIFIGSCAPSERSNFLRFYMRSQKLKTPPMVEFRLVMVKK